MINGSRTRMAGWTATVLILAGLASGCGSSDGPDSAAAGSGSGGTEAASATEATSQNLPTASVAAPAEAPASTVPEEGTVEHILYSINEIRRRPLPQTDDLERLRGVQTARNEQVIQLATELIARTHESPESQELFNEAVHQLMESRLQLALQGHEEHIDLLYKQADSLYQRDPKSKAAIDAARVRVRFAHTNARRFADKEPKWLEELANQARSFATSFPQEDIHAVELLYAAGRSCELHGLTDEAVACYSLIEREFAQSRNAKAATVPAILRRLQLPGRQIELAGPSIDGRFVRIDEYRGRAVLVVFWASGTPRVHDYLPAIRQATEKLGDKSLAVIGVNLDEDQLALEDFVERNGLNWPQIFHSDESKRRWDHPIARYYGLRDIPAVWLVNQEGVVVSTSVTPEDLLPVVQRHVARVSSP